MFHFRNNAPGEESRKGSWSAEERRLFMLTLLRLGANVEWGLFAKHIPGRVGYQCSDYYRFPVPPTTPGVPRGVCAEI